MAEGAGERKLLKETLQANKERYLSTLRAARPMIWIRER